MKHLQKFPIINESRSQEMSEEKFKEILKTKCSNWSKTNTQIYRGISKGDSPFLYINPKGHDRFRGSQEGYNFYGIIMDNGEQWKDYPKRSESIIATNDWSFTSDYANDDVDGNLNYHIVIPFDNTTWGITPKDDLWFAYDVDVLGLRDLSEFNNIVGEAISRMRGITHVNINTLSDLKITIGQIDYKDTDNIKNSIEKITNEDWYQAEISEFGENTTINKLLTSFITVKDSESMLELIMNSLSPENFSLQLYDNQGIRFTKQTQECWSDGECLMIRRDYFEKIFA